jgi:uridylate kinase
MGSLLHYKRVLLKLSGEALAGTKGYGFEYDVMRFICREIAEVRATGVQIGIVVGAGNIFRGGVGSRSEIDRCTGDTIGMLGTVINALALKDFLRQHDIPAIVLSAISIAKDVEFFNKEKACAYLERGEVVIFAGGTGNPFFTTDTAAALRSLEIGADVLMKATKVDGIYDSDPVGNPNAKKFPVITHEEALRRQLGVMDAAAFHLCMNHGLPIIIFRLMDKGNFKRYVAGESAGSLITKGEQL